MKCIVFLICLLPFSVLAQPVNGKVKLQTDSFRSIELPKLKGEPYFLVQDSVFAQKEFVINTPKQYYQMFAHYPADSLPLIDFAQYQLKPVSRCIYHAPALRPYEPIEQCGHRQACFYKLDWFLIRRKQ